MSPSSSSSAARPSLPAAIFLRLQAGNSRSSNAARAAATPKQLTLDLCIRVSAVAVAGIITAQLIRCLTSPCIFANKRPMITAANLKKTSVVSGYKKFDERVISIPGRLLLKPSPTLTPQLSSDLVSLG